MACRLEKREVEGSESRLNWIGPVINARISVRTVGHTDPVYTGGVKIHLKWSDHNWQNKTAVNPFVNWSLISSRSQSEPPVFVQ